MALVWHKVTAEAEYKVCLAGNSIRLYRNAVLHSQWNPKDPFKGQLWELFLLSSFDPQRVPKKVLLLGLGGGAVVKLLQRFFPTIEIDAIELDKNHISVAKRFFSVDKGHCNVIHAEADEWLRQNRSGRYDLIIDDVFHEKNGEPFRAISYQQTHLRRLLGKLTKEGVLVVNFADAKEWKDARAAFRELAMAADFNIGLAVQGQYQNRIAHISRRDLEANQLWQQLQACRLTKFLKYWRDETFQYRLVRRSES
jgi:spermidine synthase